MSRLRASEDPARRWRHFCRRGWRMAGLFAALWFGGLALLFRVAPAPEPAPRGPAGTVAWWPAPGGAVTDYRTLWTPAAFALSTPAGFSHTLRRERAGLPPPVQAAPPAAAYLERGPAAPAFGPAAPDRRRFVPSPAGNGPPAGDRVFPPRPPGAAAARIGFPDGWESRLFSGIDLNFAAWTNSAWNARVEMRFDGRGVPVSMLLAQPSGLPDVDRRLVRSAYGWRLLEPAAPRAGTVEWSNPWPGAAGRANGGPT